MEISFSAKFFSKLLILELLFLLGGSLLFAVPAKSAAPGMHIGGQCTSNSQCRSNDCEESDIEDAQGDNKWFCDCNDDQDCTDEYGPPTDGGKWSCIDDGPNDLDYCLSYPNKGDVHLPVETERASVWDAIFDHQATRELTRLKAEGLKPELEIRIPGLKFSDKITSSTDAKGRTILHVPYLAEYLAAIYKFGVAIVSIVAVTMMIQQGFAIIMSGGGEGKSEAYHRIGQIIVGLFILWSSYTILYILNPDLINLRTLDVQFVEREPLSERAVSPHGGVSEEARPEVVAPVAPGKAVPIPKGKGAVAISNTLQCPELKPGVKFTAAFTTYYGISKDDYGKASIYKGIYKGNDPALRGMGDFFCEVSMECGCPKGYNNAEGKQCISSKKSWPACKYFDATVEYCSRCVGKWCHKAGETIAASTCFPRGTQLKVGDRIVSVTDRGAGIIGTHFDLFLGFKGEPDFLTDTSWLTPEIEVVKAGGGVGEKELARMRKSYDRYSPGTCKPGYNC